MLSDLLFIRLDCVPILFDDLNINAYLHPEVSVVNWLILKEIDITMRVQILHGTDCIPHHINTLWKGITPIIFFSAMGKLGRLGSFT